MKPSLLVSAITLVGAALHAPAGAAPILSLQSQASAAEESSACQCTCADCVAKHGAKAETTAAPAAIDVSTLPELGADVDAEVAKVLAMDLAKIDALLGEVEAEVEAEMETKSLEQSEVERVLAVDLKDVEGLLMDVTNGTEVVVEVLDVPAEAPQGDAAEGERGYLGITLGAAGDDAGAVVGTVNPGSPADKAGLRPGDVIVVAEEFPIESADDLIAALVDLKVGDTASLELERGEKEWSVDVVLAPRMEPAVQRFGVIAPGVLEPIIRDVEVAVVEDVEEIEEEIEEEVEVQLPREVRVLRELGYVGDEPDEDGSDNAEVERVLSRLRGVELKAGQRQEIEERVVRFLEEREMGGDGSRRVFTFEVDVDEESEVDRGSRRGARVQVERRVVREERQRTQREQRETRRDSQRDTRRERRQGRRRGAERAPRRRGNRGGYVEIETRRERRPAPDMDRGLSRRIDRLEDEIAELTMLLAEMRAELNRRNPR